MPDGVHFLFQADDPDDEHSGLALQALGSTTPVHVRGAVPMNAQFAEGPGLLLYADASSVTNGGPPRIASLVLARFSPLTGEVTGAPAVVLGRTRSSPPHRRAVAMSSRGDLALQPQTADPTLNVAIYDRNGREVDRLTGAGSTVLGISADGNRLVLEQSTGAERFCAVRTRGGTTSRVTSDPRIGSTAFLSEDGSTLVYDLVTSPRRLVARSLDDDKEIDIPISLEQWSVLDVSANGDTLVLMSERELALLGIDGTSGPRVVAQAPTGSWSSRFATASLSPDGRWLAFSNYSADDVERVWLYSTADGARRFEVSEGGGSHPFWKGDSSTLYFIDRTGSLVAVDMAGQTGPSLPRHLFRLGPRTPTWEFSCVAVDQDRFGCQDYSTNTQVIEVRLNWLGALPGLR